MKLKGDADVLAVADEELTDRLLQYLRTPASYLERVDEHIDLQDTELTRRVTCVFRAGALKSNCVIDLLRPKKGDIANLRIVSCGGGDEPRRLSHREHVAVAHQLITRRFGALLRSVELPKAMQDEADNIVDAMLSALNDLLLLPEMHPDDAAEIMERYWVPLVDSSGSSILILEPLKRWPGLFVDATQLGLMHQLCLMLSSHYLALYSLPASKSGIVLEYEYSHPLSLSPDREKTGRPKKWFRENIRAKFGEIAPAFRVHIPMAKKAGHYSLVVEPPVNFLIWRATVLRDNASSPDLRTPAFRLPWRKWRATVSPMTESWASTLKHGRAASVFVSSGAGQSRRLYVGLEACEIPWLSSARTLLLTTILTVTATLFTVFAEVSSGFPGASAALVVAVVGFLASGARDEFPPDSLFRSPLQSRIIRILCMFLVVLFAVWLLSRAEGVKFESQAGVLQSAGSILYDYGGMAISASLAFLAVVTLRRFVINLWKSSSVISGGRDRNYLYKRRNSR